MRSWRFSNRVLTLIALCLREVLPVSAPKKAPKTQPSGTFKPPQQSYPETTTSEKPRKRRTPFAQVRNRKRARESKSYAQTKP